MNVLDVLAIIAKLAEVAEVLSRNGQLSKEQLALIDAIRKAKEREVLDAQ